MSERFEENETTQVGAPAEAAPEAGTRTPANKVSLASLHDTWKQTPITLRVIIIGAAFAAVAIVSYVVLYLQTGAWQILLDIVGLVLGAVCLLPAYRLALRQEREAAGYWILASIVIVFATGVTAWSGTTVHQTISVALLFFLVGSVLRPHRWRTWLAAFVLYLAYALVAEVLLAGALGLIERYPILDVAPATQYLPFPLALAIMWQVGRTVRFSTIRTRLLASFVTLVLLPTLAVSAGSAMLGFGNGESDAIAHLEAVASFKEDEVDTWVQTKRDALASVLAETASAAYITMSSAPYDVIVFARALLSLEAGDTVNFLNYSQSLRLALDSALVQTREFDDLSIVNLEGAVLVSTNAELAGTNVSDQPYFQQGQWEPIVQPPFENPLTGKTVVVAARPITSRYGDLLGILIGSIGAEELTTLVTERTGLTGSGRIYLVGSDHTLLGDPERTAVDSFGVSTALDSHENGSSLYESSSGANVAGVYRWLPTLQAALIAEQNQSDAFRTTYTALGINLGITLLAVAAAVIAAFIVTRSIATPLAELAGTATQVAAGDLEHQAEVMRGDEVGELASAFNSMTTQLRSLVGSLEQRVADRTRYLQAAADVGRAAVSILEPDQLMTQVVELIRERFGLYYVGLFLVGETGEWAVLRAGTGAAGQAMLARGHQIRIGEGMIGWSIANARARVALDVGGDAVRLATAELPQTRSEGAIPLRSRGQVIGALTVQSEREAAFDEAALAVLQTMADQVAVALENARLFTESQTALEAAHRAYGELSGEAWRELTAGRPDLGFRSDEQGITGAGDTWRPEMEQALRTGETALSDGDEPARSLAVPIRVRGDVIGVLHTQRPDDWTPDEVGLLEEITEQLAVALDGARLYQDTQRRATREQLTREITDRLRRASDMEGLMQITLREMAAALDTSSAFVQFSPPPEPGGPDAPDGDED